jgi:hypothetical protein
MGEREMDSLPLAAIERSIKNKSYMLLLLL